MRAGIDGIPLCFPLTGVGRYTLELSRELALLHPDDEFEVVAPYQFAINRDALPSNVRLMSRTQNLITARWWLAGLPIYLRRARYGLFHGTNFELPLTRRLPTVLTIHDLSLLLHPETHESDRVKRARRRLRPVARMATMIITPTEAVKREVVEHLRILPEKIVAVPNAPNESFKRIDESRASEVRRRLGVEDEFILFVGTIEPRKNLSMLLHAFESVLRQTERSPQLVIAGKTGWLRDEFEQTLEASAVRDRILLTGFLTDEDICALYSTCRVLVYPSVYEGFGLPPLEAMACGAPVITSRIPAISEIVGDAALLVDPLDQGELARALARMLEDERMRSEYSRIGVERAAAFTWKRTAERTMEVYQEALKRH